jgi:hypothetical protein
MDVGLWLRSLGLGQYEAAFRDNDIDEAVLAKLTVDDLKDLGVASVGHRRKIMSAIDGLNTPSAAPEEVARAPVSRSPSRADAARDTAERRVIASPECLSQDRHRRCGDPEGARAPYVPLDRHAAAPLAMTLLRKPTQGVTTDQ